MAQTYTPTNSPTPTFGQSGSSVLALQTQLNQQNLNKPGYVPLVLDGKYGPLTQAATSFGQNNSPILSSSGVGQQYNGASQQLDQLALQQDPYMGIFEQMNKAGAANEKAAISSATAAGANQQRFLQGGQEKYMAGLETAGVRSGANRYLPEYQAGIMENARQGYLQKFSAIDTQEKVAIAEAKAAKLSGDVKTMTAKLDYVQALRKAKADAISEANKMQWEKTKFDRQMEQNESQFSRKMALDWASENRLGAASASETASDEVVQTESLNLSKGQTRRLALQNIPPSAITAISAFLTEGKTFEEAYAELPAELQAKITPRAKNILKKAVTTI